MPKKYHRPPTVKRRKSRKTSVPYTVEPLPAADNGGVAVADEMPEAVTAAKAPSAAVREETGAEPAGARPTVRHITRDHSYVKAEIVRILIIGGFLIASILITAILRG